ncbi:MAG TPA: sigma-70 family RNA polymerase sigma factor [Planctomycetota bacterium]
MRALARSLAGPRVEADDLEQEAWLAVLRSPPDAGRPHRPWLARVVANLARRRGRREAQRRAREEARAAERPEASMPEVVERFGLLEDVVHAVMRLEEPSRSTILLYYHEGLGTPEIARRQGVPEATVRQRLGRGRTRLREALKGHVERERLGLGALAALARTSLARLGRAWMGKPIALGTLLGLVTLGLWRVTNRSEPRSAGATPLALGSTRDEPPAPEARAVAEAGAAAEGRASVPRDEAQRGTTSPPGSLRVRVVRVEDGATVAGEIVLLRWSEGGARDELALTTDAAGQAHFQGLRPGTLQVTSVRQGDAWQRFELRAGRTPQAELVLPRGVSLEVAVVDGTGAPVPAAEVWISEPWDRLRGHRIGIADPRGCLRIEDAQPFGHNWIGARAPGFAQSPWHYFEGEVGTRVELTVALEQPGATVVGRVLDGEGRGLEGARVLIGHESADWAATRAGAPPQRARTDAAGRFRLEGVPLDELPLHARAPGLGSVSRTLRVRAPETELELVLAPEARLAGHVLDPRGAPVAGALVYTDERDAFASAEGRTDDAGRFQLCGLGSGRTRVTATHAELGRARTELTLRSGEEGRWDATLVPVPRLFGRVLDDAGAGVPHVRLTAWVPVEGEPVEHGAWTDSEGRFGFDDLPDRPHRLVVEVDPARHQPFLRSGVRPALEPLELRLRPAREAAVLRGRWSAADGSALAGARVRAEPEAEDAGRPSTLTEADGSFELRLPAGSSAWSIEAPGHAPLALETLVLARGERRDLGLRRMPLPCRARVRVSTAEDTPLPELTAVWSDATGAELDGGTREGDELCSPPLPAGDVTLVVQGPGLARAELALELTSGEERALALVLAPAGVRRVVILVPPGESRPQGLFAELQDPAGRLLWDAEGPVAPSGEATFLVSAPAGTWRLRVGSPATGVRETNLEIPAPGVELEPARLELAALAPPGR